MQQRRTTSMTAPPLLEIRHQSSGLNTRLSGGELPFADYVALNRDMITQAHTGTGAADLEKIVDGNSPFELKPAAGYPTGHEKTYRRGVLLTHGLTDSPYFMRYLATFFQENGFRVMAQYQFTSFLPKTAFLTSNLFDTTEVVYRVQ